MEMHRLLRDLGERIEHDWRRDDYRDGALSAVAAKTLGDARLSFNLDPLRLLSEIRDTEKLHGAYEHFSDFAYRPWSSEKIYVEVLFWLNGTTDIHEHAFEGAFSVVSGSSLHSAYVFRPRQRVDASLSVGLVEWREAERLRPGDVREIVGGPQSAHSLFHLDKPSITVVVRNFATPVFQPQWSYYRPGVAFDGDGVRPVFKSMVAAFRTLAQYSAADARQFYINNILRGKSSELFWFFVSGAAEYIAVDHNQFSDMTTAAFVSHVHGEDITAAVLESRRVRELVWRRKQTSSPRERLVLALMLNIPGRSDLLTMLRMMDHSPDPVQTLLESLQGIGVIRTSQLDDNEIVLRHMLEGCQFSDLAAKLSMTYDCESLEESSDSLQHVYEGFRSSPLLKDLFSDLGPAITNQSISRGQGA